jgi:sugar lactone lactonase YvrE
MVDYDPASGAIENRRTFVTLGDGAGWPDGSAVDREGCVWNAEWNGGRVVRYDPDGKVERVVTVPVPLVTCCAFGGAGLKQLYITSARVSLNDEALRQAPLSGGLFVCEPGTAGIADVEFGTPF